MKKMIRLLATAIMATGLFAVQASAYVVTSIPGGTVIPMPAVGYYGTDTQTVAPGITWTATTGSVFGWTDPFGFGANGQWSGMSMAGLDSDTGTMTFAFSTPQSAVGGFLNYDPAFTPTIAVYDAGNNLIESYSPNFATGGGDNTGAFYGFRESSPNISYFTLSNAYIGVTDITAVPEPSTFLLLGLGGLGVVGYARKRKSNA